MTVGFLNTCFRTNKINVIKTLDCIKMKKFLVWFSNILASSVVSKNKIILLLGYYKIIINILVESDRVSLNILDFKWIITRNNVITILT